LPTIALGSGADRNEWHFSQRISRAAPKGRPRRPELKAIVDLLEAYEAKRWLLGREPGRTAQVV
jgi:hypothetical protein